MDDAMSTTMIGGDEAHLNSKLFDMEWSAEHENILIDWADKAMCYRWLHAQANAKFQTQARWFTIPVIIISTLTGTANFAQDRVPLSFVDTFVMIVGGLNLIAGIISTIQQFLKINELNEAHRVSSIAWDKFYRNIKIELAKKPDERIPVGQMIKMCKEEFDRMMETSPVIQSEVITKFNNTFKGNKNFLKIKKPEICDELVSTDEFRYVSKQIKKPDTLISNIITRAKQMNKYKEGVEVFIDKFYETQGRRPMRDEILEGLRDESTNVTRLERAIDIVMDDMARNANDGVIAVVTNDVEIDMNGATQQTQAPSMVSQVSSRRLNVVNTSIEDDL
jgi:hypothetical protein